MEHISSRLTFFHKFIVPVGVFLSLIDILFRSDFRRIDPNTPPYFIPIMAATVWMLWLGWPLKKVSIFGDKLYVSNFRKEVVVPISEIVNVRGNILTEPQRVTIYLRNETEFGRKIVFIAKYRWFSFWSKHPVVDELLQMARSQTENGFPTRPVQ